MIMNLEKIDPLTAELFTLNLHKKEFYALGQRRYKHYFVAESGKFDYIGLGYTLYKPLVVGSILQVWVKEVRYSYIIIYVAESINQIRKAWKIAEKLDSNTDEFETRLYEALQILED